MPAALTLMIVIVAADADLTAPNVRRERARAEKTRRFVMIISPPASPARASSAQPLERRTSEPRPRPAGMAPISAPVVRPLPYGSPRAACVRAVIAASSTITGRGAIIWTSVDVLIKSAGIWVTIGSEIESASLYKKQARSGMERGSLEENRRVSRPFRTRVRFVQMECLQAHFGQQPFGESRSLGGRICGPTQGRQPDES